MPGRQGRDDAELLGVEQDEEPGDPVGGRECILLEEPARVCPPAVRCSTSYRSHLYDFEQFAADLWRVSEANVDKIDVTRPWRDGGRDAGGEYLLGPPSDPVAVEFALEAKCYAPTNSVGVAPPPQLLTGGRSRNPRDYSG